MDTIKIEGVKKEIDLDIVFEAISDGQLETEYDARGLYVEPVADNGNLSDKVATLELLREAADLFRASNKPNRGLAIDNLIEELYL